MKRIIPILIAIILIGVVGYFGFGKQIADKYSYSKEMADLDEYFGGGLAEGNADGELAVVLGNELIDERVKVFDGRVYFDLDQVKTYFNDKFFVSSQEGMVLYTEPTFTREIPIGGKKMTMSIDEIMEFTYVLIRDEGGKLYFEEQFLHQFANFRCKRFEKHIQLDLEGRTDEVYTVNKDTEIRTKGGIKSPILREVKQGETVVLLEEMENWTKVKTSDSIIGYIENKRLGNLSGELTVIDTTYVPGVAESLKMDGKVVLGWHSIGGVGGNDTLDAMLQEGKGINVIAPTWFSLTDDEGTFRSFASENYVKKAHSKGIAVWGVWDNFNYKNETGNEVSTYNNLCITEKRKALEQRIVETALSLGLDGINLDFEEVTRDAGPYYVQFIRELSILTRQNGLILSVDNYMPNEGNTYYRLDVQGEFADYVVLMGYDEHWHGCKNPGSVASINFVTEGIEKTLAKNVPAEKLINALPFYTILWKTEGAEVTDSYITIVNTDDFLSRTGREPQWDEETCQNYLEWESGSATYQIWLEDEKSLQTKINVMAAHKLGGVAVWRLGYGTPETWNLVQMFAQMK